MIRQWSWDERFMEQLRAPAVGNHGYPPFFRPLTEGPGVRQSQVFDPALKKLHARLYRR